MSSTLTVIQTSQTVPQTNAPALYVVKFEITASTNAPLALFVLSAYDDSFSHPAMLYDIEAYPAEKLDALSLGLAWYRSASVTQSFPELNLALDFIVTITQRLQYVLADLNVATVQFNQSNTLTLSAGE